MSDLSAAIEAAPAKINLALHVTGRRADGYHLLESLVVFAAYGDEVEVAAAEADSFRVDGPFAHDVPTGDGNLVLKARDALRATLPEIPPPTTIHLTKSLPIASGVGGGSSDAAATLRALNRLWNINLRGEQLADIGLTLGADLPMCLIAKPLIARGIGEQIERANLPEIPMVLVNPGVPVSTPAVFKALAAGSPSPLRGGSLAGWGGGNFLPALPSSVSLDTLLAWLPSTRNDLQAPAVALAPPIATALSALESEGAAFARMSGSGATCFGIFRRQADALRAAMAIRAAQPGWFVVATHAMA